MKVEVGRWAFHPSPACGRGAGGEGSTAGIRYTAPSRPPPRARRCRTPCRFPRLTIPSSTTLRSRSGGGATDSSRSRAPQWVVALLPSSRPSLPRRSAPVQTEVTRRAAAAVRSIQPLRIVEEGRVRIPPAPPAGRSAARLRSRRISRPPVAVTGSRATVNTRNGALSSERRDSVPGTRRVQKTSNGPAKSRPPRCRRSDADGSCQPIVLFLLRRPHLRPAEALRTL